ncbi:hypothetical protein CFP56_040934 [Quercus suber]|uniref:Rubredoxin family protein n=1 Tax=Quercus suber TaxID=58331 RepID=A0AAW0IWG2_QUESU
MSSAVVAGSSSSCTATFTRNCSVKTSSTTPAKPFFISSNCQKTAFHGLSLQEAKRGVSDSFVAENRSSFANVIRRGLEVTARTTGASKTIEAEVDKPLGLTLGQKPGGRVIISAVDGGGNAAKAGLKAGDQVLYTSSFFGDELWPADKLGFTKTAIQAKSDSVYFVARATHICLDCGYVYTVQKPFDEQPDAYVCPQCRAPKKRFARYDVNTGKPIGGGLPPIGVIIGLVAGIGGVGALLVYGLQ